MRAVFPASGYVHTHQACRRDRGCNSPPALLSRRDGSRTGSLRPLLPAWTGGAEPASSRAAEGGLTRYIRSRSVGQEEAAPVAGTWTIPDRPLSTAGERGVAGGGPASTTGRPSGPAAVSSSPAAAVVLSSTRLSEPVKARPSAVSAPRVAAKFRPSGPFRRAD